MNNNKGSNSYSFSFWGTDFTSTSGFDTLSKHMEDGRFTCKTIEQFFKQRAKADEEYSKSLFKIIKSVTTTEEKGSVIEGFECLKSETEKIAQQFADSSAALANIATKVYEYHKNQKEERKKLEEQISAIAKEKSSQYRKTLDAKRNYDQRSQEHETAIGLLNQAKANEHACTAKEFNKVVSRATCAEQERAKAESAYRDFLHRLDEIRITWEKEMLRFCQSCEKFDESRLTFLREHMWIYCNTISTNCVEVDQKCENVRKSLEKINIGSDMASFVAKSRTGSDKPEPLKFEQYRSSVPHNRA